MSEDSECIQASMGSPARFSEIFERHAKDVEAFILSRIGETAKDDVLSETFLVAFRQRGKFDLTVDSAKPWLLGIATRLIHRHRAQESAHWRRLMASARVTEFIAPNEEARASERADAVAAIRALGPQIAALSRRDRDTLLLYAWGDLTYEQVAAALKVPVGTVRSRLSRIRARLSAPPVAASAARSSTENGGAIVWTA
ncbi:MAG: RNA polymerase sigma factor [Microbacterium sp.]|nr:RNA polymerase sigma factor [Microbacterium sp.]